MKIYLVDQRSDAWRQLRLGIPTASNFDKIVTPKKFELSARATDYALRLCAERLLNMTSESSIENPWMERGIELEVDAVRHYEWTRDVQTYPVGFIATDDHSMGCSPDRIVMSDERIALEIKCAAPHTHLGYLLNGLDEAYRPQIQGQILIAELDRAELYAYSPQMPAALIETRPDTDCQTKLKDALALFNANLASMFERAKALGVYQPAPRVAAPAEVVELADIARHFKHEAGLRMAKEGFVA